MNRLSLKLKITIWYTAIMIVVSMIVLTAVNSIGKEMIARDTASKLIQTVNETSKIIIGRDGRPRPIPHFKLFERGVHLAIYDSGKNLLSQQTPFGIDKEYGFDNNKVRSFEYDGATYLQFDKMVSHPHSADSYWIKGVILKDAESYAINSVTRTNFIITIIMIAVAAFGGYLIIKRALYPVARITNTAKEISQSSDLSRRINLIDSKNSDEIHTLASTFDVMLDKIEQTFNNEKQFTSDASHELRTPVAVILSECEYMKTCANTIEEYNESVDSIKRQADKMSKLISELLTISRMDRNSLQTNFENTDISELLSFVCDEQEEIHDKSFELIREIEKNIYAKVDRSLIARLFINLISNAYQYSSNDGKITVKLWKEKDSVLFSVTDNGIGISKENLPKIWERFFQADPSRTANENGSMGLGLSMVKWIAKIHGGKVDVESELGKGSTFTFKF